MQSSNPLGGDVAGAGGTETVDRTGRTGQGEIGGGSVVRSIQLRFASGEEPGGESESRIRLRGVWGLRLEKFDRDNARGSTNVDGCCVVVVPFRRTKIFSSVLTVIE